MARERHGSSLPSSGAEWRRGWPLVAGSAAMFATGPALYQNLSSLFVPELERTLGVSRGEIATAAGLGLLGALVAPFVGRLFDRIGALPVVIASALIVTAAHWLLSNMSGPIWQFQLGVALLAVSAPGLSALVFGRLIARRFDAHRGLALGVATAGIALSSIVMPPVIAMIIADHGWRAAYQTLGLLALGFGLPLALAGMRAGRADADADGSHALSTSPAAPVPGSSPFKSGDFWRLAGAVMLINMGTIGMVTQLAALGQDRGLTLVDAGLLLSAYAAAQIVGRLGIGALIDRFPAERMAALVGTVSALGFWALLIDSPAFWLAMAAVFVAGLMNGAEHDLLPFFVSRCFRLERFGSVFGVLLMLSIFGSAIGIVGFGRLHDVTRDYELALALGGGAMLVAALLLLGLRPSARADRP